ncbi:MAG: FliH/SctL family protein [Dehalococcoidales bacterium]|nr:FliH/SctL family protein [Dehalococcoidales bacterium]
MSYSSIIKLHKLRSQKVMVGPPPPSKKATTYVTRQDQTCQTGASHLEHDDAPGLEERTQTLPWTGEAEDVLRIAQAEAKAILDEANDRADEILLQAREEGYQKGYVDGLAAARTNVLDDVRRIGELARNVAVDMSWILSTSEEAVVELALSIAEKVVHKRLAEDRSLVVSMVNGALQYVDIMDVIRVRVNPEDLEILRSYWEEGQIGAPGKNIELASDPSVQVGGCIIETNSSVVDAQIETRLAEIEKAFHAELEASAR